MKQGTFLSILGLALAGSAIAATASTQAISSPAAGSQVAQAQATPLPTPSGLASMMPNPGPSVHPSASATPMH
jgi:hypothetical protein